MKIMNEDYAYVQIGDVVTAYLSCPSPIPSSLISKVIPSFYDDISIAVHQENNKKFIKTTNNDDIEFLDENDWIVDFNKLNDLSVDELITLYGETSYEYNDISDRFNAMNEEERSQNMSLYLRCKLLRRKANDIKDMIDYKMGTKKLNIPIKEKHKKKEK